MPEPGYNESSVVLPSLFGPPGAAMENALDRQQQDKRFEYQKQRELEGDEWRKVNLIKELTNLDDYRTGSDVADAVGNKLTGNVLQKYTAAAKNMSPSELLSKIQSEMGSIHTGLQGIKSELDLSDKELGFLKGKFPSLNVGELMKMKRSDIVNRHLNNGEQFQNPINIQPSSIDLADPEFLSDFVQTDDKLREGVLNPRKSKAGAATGNIIENVEYGGEIPFYSDVNYTSDQMKDGFLPKNFKPTYKPKEVAISPDILKGKDGKQLMGVPDEVLQEFSEGERGLQLIQATKKKFPNYKDLSADQKKAAMSSTLRERLGDEKELPFITSKRAPVQKTTNINNMGGASGTQLNNIVGRIKESLKARRGQGQEFLPAELLKQDEADLALKAIRNRYTTDEKKEIALSDYKLIEGDDGSVRIFDKNTDDFVAFVGEETDVPNQITAKAKAERLRQIEEEKKNKGGGGSYKIKGKTYSEKDLIDMGYTIDQIKQYKTK